MSPRRWKSQPESLRAVEIPGWAASESPVPAPSWPTAAPRENPCLRWTASLPLAASDRSSQLPVSLPGSLGASAPQGSWGWRSEPFGCSGGRE